MAEVAAVDLRHVGERTDKRLKHSALLIAERACFRRAIVRFIHLSSLAVAFTLLACSASHHTVGVFDVNAVTGGSSGMRAHNGQAGTGGVGSGGTPIDDGSVGTLDAGPAPIPDAAPQCMVVLPARPKRLNLYLMVDTNFLIADGGQWDKVKQGILDYARSEEAAGTGLGMRLIDPPLSIPFFPLGSGACEPSTYMMTSDAAIVAQPLPANLDEITRVLGTAVTGSLTTPLGPALQGALDLTFSLKNTLPDEEQAVVLLSDGFLDLSCTTSPQQLIQTAKNGRELYNVRSYMLELLDPTLQFLPSEITDNFPDGTIIPLDPVASAGGTHHARSFNVSAEDPSALARDLLEIQRDAQPCEYALPDGTPWEELLLAVDTGVGPGPLARLNDSTECGSSGGAYLSYIDPVSGTQWAKACDTSCLTIKEIALDPLWIVGCDL